MENNKTEYEDFLLRVNSKITDPELMNQIIIMVKEMDKLRKKVISIQSELIKIGGEWDTYYCPCCSANCDEYYSS